MMMIKKYVELVEEALQDLAERNGGQRFNGVYILMLGFFSFSL
jgi:hypothetical protein